MKELVWVTEPAGQPEFFIQAYTPTQDNEHAIPTAVQSIRPLQGYYDVSDINLLMRPRSIVTKSFAITDDSIFTVGVQSDKDVGQVTDIIAVDLLDSYTLEQARLRESSEKIKQSYMHRILELHRYAFEDKIQMNRASEQDFWAFVGSTSLANEAAIFLMDNGNLRAVWKDDKGGHAGIHFFGDHQVEYVIFKRRAVNDFVSRVAGHDTLAGVRSLLFAFDLDGLVGV